MKFFMENNNQRVFIFVTIATALILVIIFAGVTYAFFTANNPEGSTAQIISKNGIMLITYDDGTDSIEPVTDIQPSNTILVNKTFTLTGANTTVGMSSSDGLPMPYKVGIQYISTFSDGMMHYYIKEVNRSVSSNVGVEYTGETNQTVQGNPAYTGYSHGTFNNGSRYTEMVTGKFPASLNNQTITFNLIIQFPDNNENQDSEKGKTFNGKVVINQKNTLSNYFEKLDLTDNGLEIDDTTDKNIRYVGASPKNYIKFNDETWRIIGIFNNITTIDDDGNEKKETLVKIVRNETLGYYSWDTSKSTINSGRGVNEWSQANLMTELNTDYLDTSKMSGTTQWYSGTNDLTTGATYDYGQNIKSNWIDKIANVKWNLGGYNTSVVSVLNIYNAERGVLHISNPTDGITRNSTWNGKIALVYPSDYGYASANTTCRSDLSSTDCKNNNWLSGNIWTLSPDSSFSDSAFVILDGVVNLSATSSILDVRPTLYLKSDIVIAGGTGDANNPYKINYNAFGDDSWETIADNVKSGNASKYSVGSEKEVEIDGTSYTVRVANSTTPAECNGTNFSQTACGFVVEFTNVISFKAMNSTDTNVGGWKDSEMRSYLNEDLFNRFPADLKKVIIDTKVISGHGSTEGENNFVTNDKLYLLSAKEVLKINGGTAYSKSRQLDYYADKNVTKSSNYDLAIKKYYSNNANNPWWLRDAGYTVNNHFVYVSSKGEYYRYNASSAYGVSPAFRIG